MKFQQGNIGTAGNNFENVWWDVSQPGGLYYLPDPGPSLTCAQMETNRESLRNSRDYWTALVGRGGLNSEEQYYANLIIDYYTNRMQQYADVMLRSCTTPGTGTQGPATDLPTTTNTGGDQIPITDPGTTDTGGSTTDAPKTNWLLIGGAVGLGFLFMQKKKGSTKRRVSGMGIPPNIQIALTLAGIIITVMTINEKKLDQPAIDPGESQQPITTTDTSTLTTKNSFV